MTRNDRWLALVLVILAGLGVYWLSMAPPASPAGAAADPANRKLGKVWVASTSHYLITTRATMQQTTEAGAALEALYREYARLLQVQDQAVPKGGLQAMLYKDRAQFAEHQADPSRTEPYYRKPSVYAFVEGKAGDRFRSLLLAATLQLDAEVAHLPAAGWIDQGLAYYFSSSRLEDWSLAPGHAEASAYPLPWLRKQALSGDARADFAAGKLLPLRELLSGAPGANPGGRADASAASSWSLVHFLLHYDHGRYAAKFRELVASGGALQDFERLVGPVDAIETEWYGYARGLAGGAGDQQVIVVD